MTILRQGDLLFTKVSSLPKGAVEEKVTDRLVVAEGEHTGHKHLLTATKERPVRQFKFEGVTFLQVETVSPLTHEEHGTLELIPGVYKLGNEREYSYFDEEIQAVKD